MDLCGNGVGAGFVHIKNFAACLGGFPTNMTGVAVPVDGVLLTRFMGEGLVYRRGVPVLPF
jgi:hypothetical protein